MLPPRRLAPLVLLAAPVAAQTLSHTQLGPPGPGAVLRCAPAAPATPTWDGRVDLAPFAGCAAQQAWPWSAAWTPDGTRLYASLFGGLIGSGGCTVVRVDPLTRQVVATVATGEGPEEIAFVTWPDGSLRYGFVSDSAASTVTVFDAADQTVATVPIPWDAGAQWPTAFPFGLLPAPDGARVYVGTGDGRGLVFAIDVASLTRDDGATLRLAPGRSVARMAWHGDELALAATREHPGYQGSTAELWMVDPAAPAAARWVVLASSPDASAFPSPQELAVDCDGRVWVAGFDLGPRVLAVDPAGPSVLGSVPTHTANPLGKFQALALTDEGLLVAAELFTSELALVDVRLGAWVGTLTPLDYGVFHGQPHAAAVAPDGGLLAVTFASSEDLALFRLR